MRVKSRCFWLLVPAFLLFVAGISPAQESNQTVYARIFQNGIRLYQASYWNEAAFEFRRAQEIAGNVNDWSQALYWVILSELGYSDYGSALRDMGELERRAPASAYARDMVYHRARIYYNQGYFEDALILFEHFSNSISDNDRESADRKAAAFFWMGECLYTMGQYDEADRFYSWVITRYPESPKTEISSYRIDLIKQKRIENELLALLQWSHEESLRSSEDYRRRLRTYESTLNAYQRRIAELTQNQNQAEQSSGLRTPDGNTNEDVPINTAPSEQELLLERARQLVIELQWIIREYEDGGSVWSRTGY
ncbi:MAG: tetratricopeptide repeat protein [Treponema sp.]|jgi:outer membrane protein assembly factor BamD (BamD/ComL family)|nr:tetratricopeptide repeat protein [Treponema sp.]